MKLEHIQITVIPLLGWKIIKRIGHIASINKLVINVNSIHTYSALLKVKRLVHTSPSTQRSREQKKAF